MLFRSIGGRRPTTIPLVHESFDWNHGVFLGSIMGSELTAAAISDKIGQVRRDPFAMLPFIGYHVCDYLQHWLDIGGMTDASKLPKIFYVNWFRKDDSGRWLWPGFGENSRVLKWVVERCAGKIGAKKTAIGYMPEDGDIDITGLSDVSDADMKELLSIDKDRWLAEVESVKAHFAAYGERLPAEFPKQLAALEERVKAL